jgi:hypothetical protein
VCSRSPGFDSLSAAALLPAARLLVARLRFLPSCAWMCGITAQIRPLAARSCLYAFAHTHEFLLALNNSTSNYHAQKIASL